MMAVSSCGGVAVIARYLLSLEAQGLCPGTLQIYRHILLRYEGSGVADPAEYLAGLPSRRMRAQHGIVLRCYFRWCVARDYMAVNPLDGLAFREPRPEPVRPFSDTELARLLAACCSPLEHMAVVMLLDTGMRASELCELRWADVMEGVIRVKGKGQKTRFLALSERGLRALEAARGNDGRVVDLTRLTLYGLVVRLGKRAGVENVHPHRFRHTFAHRWLTAGRDIGDLRVLLGHASFQMTMRYAAYYESERAIAAHRRFLEAG
jgi:integrase